MRVSCHFVLRARRPARSTLFPYTTLFRSTITQDTLNRVRNLGRGHDNFIPIDLRNRLDADADQADRRSEEHTSELQSLRHLVCRLLLEKKKKDKLRPAH